MYNELLAPAVPMSTATLQPTENAQLRPPRAASAQGHRQYLRSQSNPTQSSSRSASNPHPTPAQARQQERQSVLKHAENVQNKEIIPAEHIPKDPDFRKLGASSQYLTVNDFDLMRTLGTGEYCSRSFCSPASDMVTP